MRRLVLWLRSVLLRDRLEREMQSEMAEHIERSVERLVARGMAPDEARREALRQFGNVTYHQEEGRIARGTQALDTLMGDIRFALRHFVRHPLSTLTMVAVLSIGIAINVVLFTLVYSFTDRPPSGVQASHDLVRLRGSQRGVDARESRAFTRDEVDAYAGLERQFASVAAWTSLPVTATAQGADAQTLTATFVTPNYFGVLRVQPTLGRGLVDGQEDRGVVLSFGAWTRVFAQDSSVVGRTLTVADVPFTIVGIAPPRFRGAAWEARDDMQLWLQLSNYRHLFPGRASDVPMLYAIGRLQPGVTRAAANAAVKRVAARLASERPVARAPDASNAPNASRATDASDAARDPSVDVVPLLADNLEPGFESSARFVKLAFAVLGLLTLLVTCANLGALQTGLALARRREMAIRLSLGAQRTRVIRQLVTESLMLSLLAALGAVALKMALLRTILGIVGTFSFELVFDGTVIGFAFGVALAAGLLFGLSPALHATRVGIAGVLKESATALAGGRARLQRQLVIGQIALTQPLAVCVAAVVLVGIADYRNNPPNAHGASIIQLRLASVGAPENGGRAEGDASMARTRERLQSERIVERLREVSGITNVAWVPNGTAIGVEAFRRVDGAPRGSGAADPFYLAGRAATPGYLALVGTPIVLGRDLQSGDTSAVGAKAIPMIIGDDMARTLWGDASPIGRRVTRADGTEPLTLEVVGVYRRNAVAKGHSRNPFPVVLPPDPRLANGASSHLLLLRTITPPDRMMPTLRSIVRDVAPRAAIVELRTLAALEEEERFVLWSALALFSSAGLVVLLLCALGLYAVVAFDVGQRTSEIAVRMAIGARAREIVRHFASNGLRLTMIGVALGLPLSLLGLHLLLSLAPSFPDINLTAVMAVVAIGVSAVALAASWIPASRAAEVDPAAVLRGE